jgi:L-serine deaminase
LANVAWAFVTVDSRASKLFETVRNKAEAFATVVQRARQLFTAVAEETANLKVQDLANIVWGLDIV